MLILGGFNAKSPFSGVRKLASELNFYRQFSYPQDTSYSISRVPDQFGVNFVQSKEEPTHEAHRFASRGDRCWYMHNTYWKIIDSSYLCQEKDGLSALLLGNLVTWCSLEESVAFRI